MRSNRSLLTTFLGVLMFVLCMGAVSATAHSAPSDDPAMTSCAEYMEPKRAVNGQEVGQEECLLLDVGAVDGGDRVYQRLEIGVTGTLEGWITKEGARANHFTSAPDFVFTHYGNRRPRFHGILRYEAAKGTSATLLYPTSGWNGKLYLMVHGSGGSFRFGSMKRWDLYVDRDRPFADVNKLERSMLRKGYAVARLRRNAERDAPGDYEAVLEGGEVWPELNVGLIPELMLEKARLVKNLLQARLGRRPTRTYWYGKSGGAMNGTLVNYLLQDNPALNKDRDGTDTIDGMLWDDVGGGMFVPVLFRSSGDVLYRTAEARGRFIKTIEITHQAYPLEYFESESWKMERANIPEGVSPTALLNKRRRARMLLDKGLGDAYRMYEVRGVSHNGGESLPTGKNGDVEILNLSRLTDGLIDLLDAWVEKGVAPPPNKADVDLGSGNRMNAVRMPEVACPRGVYFPFPPSLGIDGVGSTSLALFEGEGLEPLDGLMRFVDMNENGRRDRRESMTAAWRRLGLLGANEAFSRAKYVTCVERAVATLRKENFITDTSAELYVQEARAAVLPAQAEGTDAGSR